MKQPRLNLCLSIAALLTITSCSGQPSSSATQASPEPVASEQSCPACETCESAEPKKMTYGHYTLKDSVTDLSEIEGYPWINGSMDGMLGKVEKPEAKHDFFGYSNYEEFEKNPLPDGTKRDGGKIMESKQVTENQIKEIMTGDNPTVQAVLQMLKEGAKDKILADVADLLNPETAVSALGTMFSSKALFEGQSRFLKVEIDESKKVHLSFVLNFESVTLPIYYVLATSSQKLQEYLNALTAYLELIGLEREAAETLFNTAAATLMPAIATLAKASIEPHVTTIGQMDFDFGPIDVKAALLDLGLNEETEVTMSDQAYLYLTALAGMDQKSLAETLALCKLFDNRFLVGAADFRGLATNQFAGLQGLELKDITADSTDEEVAQALFLAKFPKAFDQIYIDRFIKPSTKQRIDDLIEDVIAEYMVLFDEQDWLADETKQAAKDKLGNMWHMSFYCDGFMDEGNLFKVSATDAIDLANDYHEWYAGIMTSCPWSGNVLTSELSTTNVNALYSTVDNAFAIYHGVCSSYIEGEDLSTEKLYGYIGSVIGHEISHGFDSTGANFDLNGQKHDWWTVEDRAAFQSKVDKIADHYTNGLHGYHDHNYNGTKLTGEAIADMGGVRVMLRLAEKQESFDYREFFASFAENFAIHQTRKYGVERIAIDGHPEEHLRVNVTLSQFDEFAKTYDVKEGDGMYVAPEDRLAIW